jgi:hypothetical protein
VASQWGCSFATAERISWLAILTLDCALDAELPPGTAVAVEFRAGDAVDHPGIWRQGESGQPAPAMQYRPTVLQYRLTLSTEEPMASPIVRALRFDWSSEIPAQPPRQPSQRVHPQRGGPARLQLPARLMLDRPGQPRVAEPTLRNQARRGVVSPDNRDKILIDTA